MFFVLSENLGKAYYIKLREKGRFQVAAYIGLRGTLLADINLNHTLGAGPFDGDNYDGSA